MKRLFSLFTHAAGVAITVGCIAALASTATETTHPRLVANAYIMDGTTLPTPSQGFIDSAIKEFIVPTVPGDYTGIGLTTPEHVVGIHQSIAEGAAILEAAMAKQQQEHPGEPFVVFGYSQSTQIISLVKSRLEERRAAGETVPNVTFVGIGGGDWAANSITSRLAGLVVPIIDFRFEHPPANVPDGIPSVQILRQYDGLGDTTQFVTNPVALANSLLGALLIHGLYAPEVSLDEASPKYVPGTITRQDGSTTYYFIPTADLPLLDPLRFAGVPEALIDIAEPFVKVLVDAGYDREVPFNKPTPAQLFPVIDPATLTIRLAAALLEGVNNAAKIVGGQLPGYSTLAHQLDSVEAAAFAGAAPYREAVRAVNDAVNPIAAFNRIEGTLVKPLNDITNALGIPTIANQVLGATLFQLSAWGERNILAPEEGAQLSPIATIARHFLKRVAPRIDADQTTAATSPPARSLAAPAEVDDDGANRDNDRDDPPKKKRGETADEATEDSATPRSRTAKDEDDDVDDGDDVEEDAGDKPDTDKPDTDKPEDADEDADAQTEADDDGAGEDSGQDGAAAEAA